MGIPKIRKEFRRTLKETAKAMLFQDFDGSEYWVPKSVCTLVKEKKDKVIATLAVFKFEEITGIEVEDMTKPFVSLGGEPLERHRVSGITLKESKSRPLYAKQREILLQQHIHSRYHALFWEAGTGKTLCSLTLANSFYHAGTVQVVVVFCPAHIKDQWEDYSNEYFPDLPVKVFSIQSSSFDKSLPKLIAKYESISQEKYLIIDESHLIKNQTTKRTKNIYKHIKADYATICTATPIGINAGDLYYQFSMLDKSIVGEENYNGFQKKFLLLGGWDAERVVALQHTKQLSDRISPYISFLKKQDIRHDMPQKQYLRKEFDLSNSQHQAIMYINRLIVEIQAKTKTGYIPKEKTYQITGFLQKIASGFVPTDEELHSVFSHLGTLGQMADNVKRISEVQYQSNNNRVRLLKELLKTYDDPAIIWCKYLDELEELRRTLPDSHTLTGETTGRKRWQRCKEFKAGKFKYLIASLQLGSGIDLPNINLSINYTTTFDWIQRKQLEDRTDRINSEHSTVVIDLVAANSIDERIQDVLSYKEKISSVFYGKKVCDSSREDPQ